MRALFLDMENDDVTVVEVNGLQDYYRLIGCDLIDIANREIRGERFDIICDDEGLLKAEPQVSAVNGRGEAMLVGNLIICGEADAEGKETSLTEEDIIHIRQSILILPTINNPSFHHILCFTEY